jgi:integrase
VVEVTTTLTRLGVNRAENDGRGWRLNKPKTKGSAGDVPIGEGTLAALQSWKTQQKKQRMAAGPAWHEHGFVFTTESGSPLGNNMGRHWARLLEAADRGRGDLGMWGPNPVPDVDAYRSAHPNGPLPPRKFTPRFSMYVLRHTRLTLMAEHGVDILTISRLARHKNISITSKYYVHTKATHAREAAAASLKRVLAAV